jgi:hypothetical protein
MVVWVEEWLDRGMARYGLLGVVVFCRDVFFAVTCGVLLITSCIL